MRATLFSILLVAGLPAYAQADATTDLVKIFGRDPGAGAAYTCFARAYSDAHLASHPKQNITKMLAFVQKSEPGEDGNTNYGVYLQLNVRGLKKPFEVLGGCNKADDDKHALRCWIDCDGGAFFVDAKNEMALQVNTPNPVGISDPSNNDDRINLPKEARFDDDDKVFVLDRTALKDCSPLIYDEDVKSKVLKGVLTQ